MILLPLASAPWCNAPDWRARAITREAGACAPVAGPAVYWVWAGFGRAPAARCAA